MLLKICFRRKIYNISHRPRIFMSSFSHSKKKKVFVTRNVPERALELLECSGLQVDQWKEDSPIPRKILLDRVKGCDGLFSLLSEKIDKELLEAAGNQLKVIGTMSVGVEHVDLEECRRRGVKIGYTPDVLTEATAELALTLLLCTSRRIVEGVEAVKQGKWSFWSPSTLCGLGLENSVVGIVGLGRIGKSIASKLVPFRVKEILYSGSERQSTVDSPEQFKTVSILNLDIATNDISATNLYRATNDISVINPEKASYDTSANNPDRASYNFFPDANSNNLSINSDPPSQQFSINDNTINGKNGKNSSTDNINNNNINNNNNNNINNNDNINIYNNNKNNNTNNNNNKKLDPFISDKEKNVQLNRVLNEPKLSSLLNRVNLRELLNRSDFVIISCSLNERTENLFDRRAFESMKSNAVLVNISRGGVVNQEDLYIALTTGKIAAAGLDVTTPEPLPMDHPLVRLKNCTIFPHIGSATWKARLEMASLTSRNIIEALAGRPMPAELTGK